MKKQGQWICLALCVAMIGMPGCGKKKGFAGTVRSMKGPVEHWQAATGVWKACAEGTEVFSGDTLQTGSQASVEVECTDNHRITLGEQTEICLRDTAKKSGNSTIVVFVRNGEVVSKTGSKQSEANSFAVQTPSARATAHGTQFMVAYYPSRHSTRVHVFEGEVWVVNPYIRHHPPVVVLPGYYTVVVVSALPVPPVLITYDQLKRIKNTIGDNAFVHWSAEFHIPAPPPIPHPPSVSVEFNVPPIPDVDIDIDVSPGIIYPPVVYRRMHTGIHVPPMVVPVPLHPVVVVPPGPPRPRFVRPGLPPGPGKFLPHPRKRN
jgi:hypothetical protein